VSANNCRSANDYAVYPTSSAPVPDFKDWWCFLSSLKSSETFNIDTREFSIQQNVILRDHRVIVPKTIRALILKELHSAHFGIVKTKSLARGHCWWPGIDRDIEKMISECTDCQNTRNNPVKAETHMWESAS
jgi:hypothetical protein